MIVVTGATGKLGQLVIERLSAKLPADQIAVSVRDASKATGLRERGIRVRHGDFTDPASLRHAFEGASQVLIISGSSLGPAGVEHHGNAIEAAKAVGAGRILYTSHMAASAHSAFQPAVDHAATEALLQSSGVPFTSLRNGFYAESALWFSNLLNGDKIALPEDGAVCWTTRSDLADAAVVALTDPEKLHGITPPLTNPEALDFAAIAQIASEVFGRQVTRDVVTDDVFRQSQLALGLPERLVDGLGGFFVASRRREFVAADPTLERLLGHRPQTMRQVLTDLIATQQ